MSLLYVRNLIKYYGNCDSRITAIVSKHIKEAIVLN